MSYKKPFHRNYRPVQKGENSGYSDWAYIIDSEYSKTPEHYLRAFFMIQEDMLKLFNYIEPADINESTYSYRIHELLTRICIEVELNFKAIFIENTYTPKDKNNKIRDHSSWNMSDFKLINKTHHLDEYKIELPFWKGNNNIRTPFLEWKTNKSIKWYQAYNNSKHNRLDNFKDANFSNLIDAYAGLCALLASQFRDCDFQPGNTSLAVNGYSYFKGEFGIGGYLIVHYPNNWNESEKYNFNWTELRKEKKKFNKINYNSI